MLSKREVLKKYKNKRNFVIHGKFLLKVLRIYLFTSSVENYILNTTF